MKRIITTDTTLCSANSTVLSFREKLEVAKLLEKMKIDYIEFGNIQNEKTDPLLISTIAPLLSHSKLSICVGLDEKELNTAADAIQGVKNARLNVRVPVSAVGMEYTCHKKAAAFFDAAVQQVARCRQHADEVEFCALDATRSEKEFLVSLLPAVAEAGATHITLCDNDGRMTPDEAAGFVRDILDKLPGRDTLTVSVSFPNDMDMAVACSFTALCAGADGVKTCAFGSSAANIYPISQILQVRGENYGLSCALVSTELRRCVGQIETIARICHNDNNSAGAQGKPIDTESVSLDKNDDIVAVMTAVRSLGYDLNPEDEARVYEAFVRLAEKKTVNARELEAIVASTALQVPPTYRLVSYLTTSGNVVNASAHIKLEKDGETLEGITIGDGPIDACFVAIEHIIGHHYELDDFQIQSVTQGREAMGNALVRLRSGGKIYSGTGISTDIIGASIRAYLNALNKIVYEEAGK